jgi:preprotein translocase subunit SecA
LGRCEGLIATYREQEDYEGFKLDCIVNFGMDTKIEKEEFLKADENSLIEKLYNEATENYDRKKEELKKQSLPVFKNIRVSQGNHIENVVVPFSDGRKIINVLTNLQKHLIQVARNFVMLLNAISHFPLLMIHGKNICVQWMT